MVRSSSHLSAQGAGHIEQSTRLHHMHGQEGLTNICNHKYYAVVEKTHTSKSAHSQAAVGMPGSSHVLPYTSNTKLNLSQPVSWVCSGNSTNHGRVHAPEVNSVRPGLGVIPICAQPQQQQQTRHTLQKNPNSLKKGI